MDDVSLFLVHWLHKQPFCNMCCNCNARSSIPFHFPAYPKSAYSVYIFLILPPENINDRSRAGTLNQCAMCCQIMGLLMLVSWGSNRCSPSSSRIHQEAHQGQPTNPSGSSSALTLSCCSLPEHSDQWGRGGFLHCTSTNPSRWSSTESEAHRWTGGCWVGCKLWAWTVLPTI